MNGTLNKNDYLMKCRARNNKDIQRTLHTYLKWLHTREEIPLDDGLYPDFFIDEMRTIGRVAERLLDQLEMHASSGVNIRQLELSFGDKQ